MIEVLKSLILSDSFEPYEVIESKVITFECLHIFERDAWIRNIKILSDLSDIYECHLKIGNVVVNTSLPSLEKNTRPFSLSQNYSLPTNNLSLTARSRNPITVSYDLVAPPSEKIPATLKPFKQTVAYFQYTLHNDRCNRKFMPKLWIPINQIKIFCSDPNIEGISLLESTPTENKEYKFEANSDGSYVVNMEEPVCFKEKMFELFIYSKKNATNHQFHMLCYGNNLLTLCDDLLVVRYD